MKSFSERKGLKRVQEVAQVGSMNDELRNSIWNALDVAFWSTDGFVYGYHGSYGEIEEFSRELWFDYFKKPVDSRPGRGHPARGSLILQEIREYYFNCPWNEVYDLLEYLVRTNARKAPRLQEYLNQILEGELAGYRFIDGLIVDITDAQERALLAEVLADTKFGVVTAHLERALELLVDRKQPDYRTQLRNRSRQLRRWRECCLEVRKQPLAKH